MLAKALLNHGKSARKSYRRRRFSWLCFVFFLFCFQSAWADKILLKNGNTLEGRIERENDEAVWVELKLETGRGQTKILRTEIKSIESNVKSLKTESQVLERGGQTFSERKVEDADNQAKANGLMKKTPFFILGGIFIILIIFFFLRIKLKQKKSRAFPVSVISSSTAAVNPPEIKTAVFKRPLGVKLIWLLLGFWALLAFLFGLMFNSLAMNRVIFNLKGIKLFLFLFLNIGLPVFLFILTFGLFYLRNWVRIILIIFLIFGIGETSLSWVLKKNLTAVFSQTFLQGAKQGFDTKELIEITKFIYSPSLKKTLNQSAGHKKGGEFNQTKNLVSVLFYLFLILYLYREKTKKAFQEARGYKLSCLIKKKRLFAGLCLIFILGFLGDKLYQYAFIRFSHDAHFFMRPARSKGIIKKDTSQLKDFQEYSDLGYRFCLPPDMQRMEGSLSLCTTFLNKKKGRMFSITKLSQGEYELFTAMSYARWNPTLLLFKLIGSPRFGRTVSIQKVIFEKQEGIISVFFNDQRQFKTILFYLKDKQDNAIECLFAGKSSDLFVEEKNILNLAACIEESFN